MKLSHNLKTSAVLIAAIAFALGAPMLIAEEAQTDTAAPAKKVQSFVRKPVPDVSGTGATNFIPKWLDTSGTLGNSQMVDTGTRVGVGTLAPLAFMQVGAGTDVPNMPGTALYVVGAQGVGQTGATAIVARDNMNHVELAVGTQGLGGGQFGGVFGTRTPHDLFLQAGGNNFMIIKTSGAVGIGTLNPTVMLDVVGSVNVGGNIAAKYQDVAEWVAADEALDGGTLVVLSRDNTNAVRRSTRAYDTSVAGVVSTKPGIILGEEAENKAKIATTGRVKVHADASGGAIAIGDLLVTSDKAGYAMRSNPIDVGGVSIHRPGTIVGKALEPLKSGEGDILVLLTLQ